METHTICPNCGHCPTCGHTPVPPMFRPWPGYPRPYVGDWPLPTTYPVIYQGNQANSAPINTRWCS